MERLTERLTDKSYCISDIRAIQKETFYEDMECRRGFDLYTGKAIDKLAEYEDLEEQGKLLKLPCAVGDTVYCIYSRYTKCSAHNQEFEESSCLGCESECDSEKEYYVKEQRAYSLDWIVTQIVCKHFGKTVFLTRQEAEDKLAEMEGKQ